MRYVQGLFKKHSEAIEYIKKVAYFFRNLKTSRENKSRILWIKNAKFSGYCFYINTNTNAKSTMLIKKSVHFIMVKMSFGLKVRWMVQNHTLL